MPPSACAALPAPPSLPLPNNSASRTRFSLADDIAILLEVINFQPYTDPCRWTEIVEKLNKDLCRSYTVRSIKKRVDLIAAQFLQNDRRNLQKSGTEEEYGERDRLLQQVVDLIKVSGHRIKQPAKRPRKPLQPLQICPHDPPPQPSRCGTVTLPLAGSSQSAQREDALAYRDAESMAFCGDVLVEAGRAMPVAKPDAIFEVVLWCAAEEDADTAMASKLAPSAPPTSPPTCASPPPTGASP
ncbi:hypothetical protein HPB48_003032 [Haemaphysalis longicornis]|uniref:Uncharacterized protein n=1 Tax=Haemaphysalis longicornis TaxID=44386 RepID=A0A9J6FNB1_HAELO|nr:hypothetical protein HPB48_003032 [Haemaphysalis longicornis]